MPGYCSIDDVARAFPQFQRNQIASIQDTDIQGWIDDRKARIRSALLTRGFDPDLPPNPPLTADQSNFLRALNRDGTIGDLGDALQATITLQPGEYSIASAHRTTYERVLKEITEAKHDRMFQSGPLGSIARKQDVTPLFKGVGGAEQDVEQTPMSRQEDRIFGKNQKF